MAATQKTKRGNNEPLVYAGEAGDPQAETRDEKQNIEELTKRYNKLNTRKIQAETNLENAEKELAKLKEKARKEYGTDSVIQLRELLEAMEAENERKRSEYQSSLAKIEADLNEAERKYADVKEAKET